jgi:superfamily II DNA or RNA helicase
MIGNEEQIQAIREYIQQQQQSNQENSDDDNTIIETNNNIEQRQEEQTIPQIRDAEELQQLTNDQTDPLVDSNQQIITPEQIFRQVNSLDFISNSRIFNSICVDHEMMNYQVHDSINNYWSTAFYDETNAIQKLEPLNGNKFHDMVVNSFREAYDQIQKLRTELLKGYSFHVNGKFVYPKLMQFYVAHRVMKDPYFANLSGTGSGKTLSAILASRYINSKMTVVICPNNVIEQWEEAILKAFPDSIVKTSREQTEERRGLISINAIGKEAFSVQRDEDKHQYIIFNYDKFSQDYTVAESAKLAQQKIDFLVLDEVHFVKQRSKSNESQRHENVLALRKAMKDNNSNFKLLVMSATPIQNELNEGKSLLEMITLQKYVDLTRNGGRNRNTVIDSISNAVRIHEKLVPMSIREKRQYAKTLRQDFNVQDSRDITPQRLQELRARPLLIEQELTTIRLPKIIEIIKQGIAEGNKKTIVYTEYVTDIIEQLKTAIEEQTGLRCAVFDGEDHTGLGRFTNEHENVDILIASKPISTGVDGLQHICNRLIINTLPWTNADYEQILGRLERIDQKHDVNVFVIRASIIIRHGNQNLTWNYDELFKWNRILFKRSLADCAISGDKLPLRGMITPAEARKAAIDMLERLVKGEISTVNRSEINVNNLIPINNNNNNNTTTLLTTTEEKQEKAIPMVARTRSEFTKRVQRINNEHSSTTYQRFKEHPEEWHDFHKDYSRICETWTVQPWKEIVHDIKETFTPNLLQNIRIIDFGCGKEVHIAKKLGTDKVMSYDFGVSDENKDIVIKCDMTHTLEKDSSADVAIFSLSLMCENWRDCIAEAKRVLASNGYLFIAEITKSLGEGKRLYGLENALKEQGFIIYNGEFGTDQRGNFTFIKARKRD